MQLKLFPANIINFDIESSLHTLFDKHIWTYAGENPMSKLQEIEYLDKTVCLFVCLFCLFVFVFVLLNQSVDVSEVDKIAYANLYNYFSDYPSVFLKRITRLKLHQII